MPDQVRHDRHKLSAFFNYEIVSEGMDFNELPCSRAAMYQNECVIFSIAAGCGELNPTDFASSFK